MIHILVDAATGEAILPNSKRTTFRGETVTVVSCESPRHEGSTGRVYCLDAEGRRNGWYPSVIGAKFV